LIEPNSRRRKLLAAASALGLPAFASAALSRAARWPGKPIRIVVAFPPAGLTDVYARLYAGYLATELNQQVFVDNKPGAGAIIGIDLVAKAVPDGHTLLMTTSGTVWQNRVLYSKLPYDLDKDLTPIAVFPSGPLVVGVSKHLRVDNFRELIAYAKSRPTSMGSFAPGSYPHMLADQTNRTAGTRIQSVHYRGEAPMWLDVAAGQLELAVGSYQAFSNVVPRGVRAIGVTGTYRSPKLPQVTTLLEQGMDGALVSLEAGITLLAPRGTPEPVLQSLSQAAVDWSNTRDAARLRERLAIPSKPKGLSGTRRDWERDVPVWIKLAVDLGIKLD
jgi:tripartite-type tricarboxylate transporter receptor subunit TctC